MLYYYNLFMLNKKIIKAGICMCLSISVYSGTIIDPMMSYIGLAKLPPTEEDAFQASSRLEVLSIYL